MDTALELTLYRAARYSVNRRWQYWFIAFDGQGN